MKASRYTIATLREIPSDAEITSHRLLIRAGYIRKLASGIYSWLPIGLKVLQKIEAIIREEMNRCGAQEVMLPVVQPGELWRASGRWDQYDDGLLLKFQDRHQRDFCFGPTHEEVITDLAKAELKSHKQLPVNFYQIQTKFRDETRPRFGLLRAREFIMKDAYSFHINQASLEQTYQIMHQTYGNILNRVGLDFRSVQADSGNIGGSASTEFHVLADAGEDTIVFSTDSDYAANIEMAEALQTTPSGAAELDIHEVATPNIVTIAAVSEFLGIAPVTTVKTLIVVGSKTPLVALVLRGDHSLNILKAEKIPQVRAPLEMADAAAIRSTLSCSPGSIGPVKVGIPLLVDRSAFAMKNFVCGANRDGYHLANVNWQRDCTPDEVFDLRNVVQGDLSPDGKGTLLFRKGIEVGHIFQLGDKYTKAMKANVLDENGKSVPMAMGCYGMGVSRLLAAIIEQNFDANGIIWPTIIAPFQVIIIPVNGHKSRAVADAAENIYRQMLNIGLEVLLDDREGVRPGARFADAELIGIPHRLVVGKRGLKTKVVAYTNRRSGENSDLPIDSIAEHLKTIVHKEIAL